MSSRESSNGAAAASQNISELAHDLNNLLVGIVGNAQLLEEDVGPMQLPLVRQILECGNRATEITEQLLQNHKTDRIALVPDLVEKSEKPVSAGPKEIEGRDTILVIDDEEVVRSISAAVLSRAGYRTLVASNGPEGLRLFESDKDRIISVFLDLTMPYMRGNLVFARLKAIDPGVHVYLMSGYSDQQALFEFDTQEIEGFIQKPFQNEDLVLAVERSEELHQQIVPAMAENM